MGAQPFTDALLRRDDHSPTATGSDPESPLPMLNAEQLAKYLGMSRASIYNLMKRGLPSIKIGAARRFRTTTVDAWLDGQQADAA